MTEALKTALQPLPVSPAHENRAPLSGDAAERYVEGRLGFPMAELTAFPKWFLIETVNSCNARCIMCGIDFDKKAKAVMKQPLFEKIIDEIAAHRDRVQRVTLTLDGEPLIDKRLGERIRYVKDRGLMVHISSNASLLNEKRGRELVESGLDAIHITLDSMRKDVYEGIRVRLDYDTVLENIHTFIRLRDAHRPDMQIRVQMVQQEANLGEGAAFTAYWTERLSASDQVVVQKAHNWGNAVDVMAFGDEHAVNDIPCIAPFGTMVIAVDGGVRLCCMDVEETYDAGSVADDTIEAVWQGARMQRARDIHVAGERASIPICDGCTLWRDDKQDFVEVD